MAHDRNDDQSFNRLEYEEISCIVPRAANVEG